MRTNRTTLQFIRHADFNDVLAMFHEPETFKYIAPLEGKTDEEYLKILRNKIVENANETGFYWIARLKDTNEMIGAMNLNPRADKRIQLGYQIRKKFWGQGFATELSEAVLHFAKHERQLKSVVAVFVETHGASRRILEKLGLEPIAQENDGVETLEVYQIEFI